VVYEVAIHFDWPVFLPLDSRFVIIQVSWRGMEIAYMLGMWLRDDAFTHIRSRR